MKYFYGVPAPGTIIAGDGGGIFIAGEIQGAQNLATIVGAGSVTIINNLIQGNLVGAGDGGGIRVAAFNGQDVQASNDQDNWYQLRILNNMIVNNAAGTYGGGISLQDVARVSIMQNTIANNDSLACSLSSFGVSPVSRPGAGGIVSHLHTPTLSALSGQAYSDPELINNIIWHNRSYYYDKNARSLVPTANNPPVYADLGVDTGGGLGGAPYLNPVHCLLSDNYAGGFGNVLGNPAFVQNYQNTNVTTSVVDEAGNNIAARIIPTGLYQVDGNNHGDYHIQNDPGAGPFSVFCRTWLRSKCFHQS